MAGNLSMNSRNNRMAFVMLNFNSPEMTKKCVSSIKCKAGEHIAIIVVDNGSADGSGQELSLLYEEDPAVYVIRNKENIGFSKGLNVGYRYAKSLGYNFIALINNDTELLSDSFCKRCFEDFEEYSFAVLGPRIEKAVIDEGCNPFPLAEISVERMKKYLKRTIKYHGIVVLLARINLIDMFYKIYGLFNGRNEESRSDTRECLLNCGLHGCFWVFSPIYVEQFEGLDEITFAYCEEWILYQKCKRNGLRTLYDPRIRIWHDEHTTQKNHSTDKIKRFIFREKMEVEAAKKLLNEIETMEV